MGDSILSQAEIDALLNGDSDSAVDEKSQSGPEGDIRPYDPNTQRRVVRERLQALEIINERFARHFRMALFNLLRRSPDISVGAIKIQPYHEFARNLPVPTNLNLIHLKPLRGTALVVFSPSLVFIAVDNLFGGDGRFPTKVEGREFTHTAGSGVWTFGDAGEVYQYHHVAERHRGQYAVPGGDWQPGGRVQHLYSVLDD